MSRRSAALRSREWGLKICCGMPTLTTHTYTIYHPYNAPGRHTHTQLCVHMFIHVCVACTASLSTYCFIRSFLQLFFILYFPFFLPLMLVCYTHTCIYLLYLPPTMLITLSMYNVYTRTHTSAAYERQVVSFFRHPEVYQKISQRYSRGVRPQLRFGFVCMFAAIFAPLSTM